MIRKLRERLALIRRTSSPAGTLVDFGVWVVRNALHPSNKSFWIIVPPLVILAVIGVVLPNSVWKLAAFIALIGAASVISTILALTYLRSILKHRIKDLDHAQNQMQTLSAEHAAGQREHDRAIAEIRGDAAAIEQSVVSMKASVEASVQASASSLEQSVSAEISQQDARMRDGLERNRNEAQSLIQSEMDALSAQTATRFEDLNARLDATKDRQIELVELVEKLSRRMGRLERRLTVNEEAIDSSRTWTRDKLHQLDDELQETSAGLKNESANEAGLIEYLESTVGEMMLKVSEMESELEAKKPAARTTKRKTRTPRKKTSKS